MLMGKHQLSVFEEGIGWEIVDLDGEGDSFTHALDEQMDRFSRALWIVHLGGSYQTDFLCELGKRLQRCGADAVLTKAKSVMDGVCEVVFAPAQSGLVPGTGIRLQGFAPAGVLAEAST